MNPVLTTRATLAANADGAELILKKAQASAAPASSAHPASSSGKTPSSGQTPSSSTTTPTFRTPARAGSPPSLKKNTAAPSPSAPTASSARVPSSSKESPSATEPLLQQEPSSRATSPQHTSPAATLPHALRFPSACGRTDQRSVRPCKRESSSSQRDCSIPAASSAVKPIRGRQLMPPTVPGIFRRRPSSNSSVHIIAT